MKYVVYQFYPEEGYLVRVGRASSESEADRMCDLLEEGRSPGKPYRYVYKEEV